MGYRQISQWQGWPTFSLEDAESSSRVRKQGIGGKGLVCTHGLIVNAPERGGAGGKEEGDGFYY